MICFLDILLGAINRFDSRPIYCSLRIAAVWSNFKPVPQATAALEDESTEFDVHNPFPKRQRNASADELELYLLRPIEDRALDVLLFWKANKQLYPNLAEMARVFLAIPASSASCERSFSLAGRIISPDRCSMMPASVQAFVCTNSWISSGILPQGFRF